MADSVTGKTVYIGDFSEVRTPGSYYLELSNCDRSPSFPISSDVYLDAYRTMMLGFYGQRCGTEVSFAFSGTDFHHEACHTADLDMSYFDWADQPSTVVGGWHDAGDYGRYTVNGGFTAGLMLRTWEDYSDALDSVATAIPESGGAMPDFLAETQWQIEWLLEMAYADGSGQFSNAVKSPEFPGYVMPEDDTSPVALASASSMGTAVAAAVLAQAARVYQPFAATFADTWEHAAVRAYGWITSNLDMVTPAEDWAAARIPMSVSPATRPPRTWTTPRGAGRPRKFGRQRGAAPRCRISRRALRRHPTHSILRRIGWTPATSA